MKIKTICKYLGQSLLSGIGFLWLVLGAYYGLGRASETRMSFGISLLIGLAIGVIWFVIDGRYFSGFLKGTVVIRSNAIDTTIMVMFGDLFDQDGYKAISVNEFFDSAVDDKHVSSNSLHGQMLARCWAGNTADWDNQVEQDLVGNIEPIEAITSRQSPGKRDRYDIGTTASVARNGDRFLCVALARTCTQSLQSSASSDDLQHAVRGLLSKARSVCSGQPLNIPLLGSGLGRTGIKPNIIVHLLILAAIEEAKTKKVTDHIRIVLPRNLRRRIDLAAIERDWR